MENIEEVLSVPSIGDSYCSYKYRTIPAYYKNTENIDLFFSNY
jgi:hypothetical protein